jgi:inner membrane transporter RhtA
VPFLVDLLALRRVSARFFGLFMSVHPVLASLVGLVVLGQVPAPVEWLAVAAIVGANAVSVLSATRPRPRPAGAGASPAPERGTGAAAGD